MKKKAYILSLSNAMMALAIVGVMTSCADDGGILDIFGGGNGDGLSVSPVVSEATVVTRAQSVEELNEKRLNTLDVFVEHVTSGTGDGTFLKQYHLVATTDKPIQDQVNNWLADNWRAEGLVVGENYNIYVASNNTKTTSDVESVEALKALIYSEVEEGIAVVDEATNNISWPWTDQFADTPSGFIYKQYVPESEADAVRVRGSLYGFTTDKEFMMDGILENWTPNPDTRDQVFQPVILNRAAAKIVLTLNFDATLLKSLTHNMTVSGSDTTWTEKPDAEKVVITGAPAWRYYNFAFGAPVFTPETQGTGVEVHNSETLLRHPYNFTGDDMHAQIITYTYPNKWDEADYATKAPNLVISVCFKKGEAAPEYHYYRIPLIKSTVTEIERNHIYVVNATIATRGSELLEDVDEIEDIHYYVLPWNDESNSAAIKNEVEAVQHKYLKVNPKIYTLRGNGLQSVDINYLKASGTSVGWKLFTYDANGNQTAVVANNANGATRAWFYNSTNSFTTTYSDSGSGINWGKTTNPNSDMGVTITQSTEGVSGTSGKFTVASQALTNKAIKYIRFRVFLNEDETLFEDVIIQHFPTDNIQNITGSWSSYHTAGGGTQEVTLTTTSLTEAQSWATQYGVEYTVGETTETEPIDYATYAANSADTEHYHMNRTTVTVDELYSAVYGSYGSNWNTTIRNANSQANAVYIDGFYYWGEDPTNVGNNNNYDYSYDGSRYRYTTRYRASYTHTYAQPQYSLTVQMASTGDWVDWDTDANSTPSSWKYTYDGAHFQAKVFEDGLIYGINVSYSRYYSRATVQRAEYDNQRWYSYSSASNSRVWSSTRFDGLSNNHMYVIQISSTSNQYVLGRPYVNQTHQSQDNVVSPAFMIASQLGAVSNFSGTTAAADAATHCSRYLEVAEDGTRYTGWRLPTPSEIGVITGYQRGNINNVSIPEDYRVLTVVLGGDYYWSLAGTRVATVNNSTDDVTYLRCVRDLSAEEVDRLNGFDKIVTKYQNK
ncbi:MAG: hypothetical protein IJ209_10190 [Bacteroidaceae bacterium]|nr:hypothetical protein [Bacteroidaceae bacterium]